MIRVDGDTIKEADFTSELKKGKVVVIKKDKDDKTILLSGVRLQLQQNGQKVYEAITNEQGIATFDKVICGSYKLKEVSILTNLCT